MTASRRLAALRRRRCRHQANRRLAFTLTELLVSMALIIFIMSVLSAAFSSASKAFRDLKAAGDNAERLRSAVTMLRRDLSAPHFDGDRMLSDADFWTRFEGPPSEGFFRIWMDAPSTQWPVLAPEVPEYTGWRTMLHFAVRLNGTSQSNLFSTPLSPTSLLLDTSTPTNQADAEQRFQAPGGSIFRSQWSEVAWWLAPSKDATGAQEVTRSDVTTGFVAQPLYVLCRRQRLAWSGTAFAGSVDVPPADVIAPGATTNTEVSTRPAVNPPATFPGAATPVSPARARVNRSTDLTIPAFRFGMTQSGTTWANANGYDPLVERAYAGWPTGLLLTPGTFTPAPPVTPAPFNTLGTTDIYGNPTYAAPGPPPIPAGRVEDIVVNNVLSMDVKVLLQGGQDFVDLSDASVQEYGVYQTGPTTFPPRNPNFRFARSGIAAPQYPLVFDTWSKSSLVDGFDFVGPTATNPRWNINGTHATIPLYQHWDTVNRPDEKIRIRALKITLRIWDGKSGQTREVTMVQDM